MSGPGDLWIKVPSPFWGVDAVGFSARYPLRPDGAREVPFFVEGEADLMAGLGRLLRLFSKREQFVDCERLGEAYSWSDPISLSDEVVVMAFRDLSMEAGTRDPVLAVRNRLANQLVPMAFPFLRDCVRVARLRLSTTISVLISADRLTDIELAVPLEQIGVGNGDRELGAL